MTTTIEKCARPTSWSETDDLIPMVLPTFHVLLDSIGSDHTERDEMYAGRVGVLREHGVQLWIFLTSQYSGLTRVTVHLGVQGLCDGFHDAFLADRVRAGRGQR